MSEADTTGTPSTATKDELKAFFNKLVDARPEICTKIYVSMMAEQRSDRITREEKAVLDAKAKEDYLHLLFNPLPQNSRFDSSDVS